MLEKEFNEKDSESDILTESKSFVLVSGVCTIILDYLLSNNDEKVKGRQVF